MTERTNSTNNYNYNTYYPSQHETTLHTETKEMSERREKLNLIRLEKSEKISKIATIGGAITTAALAAVKAAGLLVPAQAIIYAGAVSLLGGIAWVQNKIELDSMLKASSDQTIGELAEEMKGR